MNVNQFNCVLAVLLGSCLISCNTRKELIVSSPDGNVRFELKITGNTDNDTVFTGLSFNVFFRDEGIIQDGTLGLDFVNIPALGNNVQITGVKISTVDEHWERVWGKSKSVYNHCTQAEVELKETGRSGRYFGLVIRAYDDGIAFRYHIPGQEGIAGFELAGERTTFPFTGDHKVWAANRGGFHNSQEHTFDEIHFSDISSGSILGTPLLIKLSDSSWAAILEANLTDWAGMYLTGTPDNPAAVMTRLSPLPDEPGVAVRSTTPRYSPWRVVMLADHPGRFIESDILHNLNEPCALDDVSWIRPGKCAWDWWWSDGYAPDKGYKLGPDTEGEKYFIDFASEMGWEYQLVDWNWYGAPFLSMTTWEPDLSRDITKHADECNILELIDYAKKKNVRTIVWLAWPHADRQMDEAFPLYRTWGISGVKVDFMDRNDQEMVNFYHRLVKKAAENHLLVDCHGAYMPTGISRTYPNFITREGVLGNEYNKWSDLITPDHCLTLPFTRGLGGEMDFTPGGFIHGTRETFRIADQAGLPYTMVRGTRCFQLAMLVVYESALQVICDSPYNYRNQPGLDFLKIVPTTWDETMVINGEVGDYITIARRSGEDWFIGSMCDWTPRDLSVLLDFLGEGNYNAHIWADAADADQFPGKLKEETVIFTKNTFHTIHLASAGGQVIHLSPVRY
jgi:alpha-glucosidase